jgi:hypothetical protein
MHTVQKPRLLTRAVQKNHDRQGVSYYAWPATKLSAFTR